MNVIVKGAEISEKEKNAYINYVKKQYPGERIALLEIVIDDDEVELNIKFAAVAFERIRRITGYLVGDLSRFNDAKRAEVRDRVKHDFLKNSRN